MDALLSLEVLFVQLADGDGVVGARGFRGARAWWALLVVVVGLGGGGVRCVGTVEREECVSGQAEGFKRGHVSGSCSINMRMRGTRNQRSIFDGMEINQRVMEIDT